MKVQVDQSKCQGHNRCYAIAPELFDVDDLGNAFAIGDGVVGPHLAEKRDSPLQTVPSTPSASLRSREIYDNT